ncbi:hypothetical protein O6H91_14G012600 [Diphasiastrum complanatum]|uniref:Uncharacterized protein n=2 Tax=Diphasiastrum complanatum TaxID=34168 RepID=A0ACC2BLS2_DIPCM|nr:hypothetical protein O6H91_14G012600 [Diphasiastrum complanatum]KAJ7530649.1 hypothetical protein O6H91_14G012600 [Diphasiastrum complanatum]
MEMAARTTIITDTSRQQQETGLHVWQSHSSSVLYTQALQQHLTAGAVIPSSTSHGSNLEHSPPPRVGFPSGFPSEKRIPGTQFVVDGFRSAGPWSVAYFLSHFHSDHYTGLTPLWNKGIIFCSQITAKLVMHYLHVSEAFVIALPMREKVMIDGCEVTLVDANHCPGAVQMLFRVRVECLEDGCNYHRYIHTGDMRYDSSFKDEACLCDFVGADAIFLDTTYCNPRFVFPSQQASVDYVSATVLKMMERESTKETSSDNNLGDEGKDANLQKQQMPEEQNEDRTLFLIATYVIGKEKVLLKVAKECKCLIYVNEKKLALLKCLNLEDYNVFTSNPKLTNLHVVGWNFLGDTWPYFRPNFANMEKMMQENNYSRAMGFVPTGWTYELKKEVFSVRKKGPFEIHLVPYSEHSNYQELREYVKFLKPHKIIPTVGLEGTGTDGKAAAAMRKHFRNLVDETASKQKFLKGYNRKTPAQTSAKLASVCKTSTQKSYAEDRVTSNQESSIVIQPNKHSRSFPSPDDCPEEQKSVKQHFSIDGMSQNEKAITRKKKLDLMPPDSHQKCFEAAFGRNARKRRASTDGNVGENSNIADCIQMPSQSISLPQGLSTFELLNDAAHQKAISPIHISCEGDENSVIDHTISVREEIPGMQPLELAETSERAVHLNTASSPETPLDHYHAGNVASSETTSVTNSRSKDASRISDAPLAKKRWNSMSSALSAKKRGRIKFPSEGVSLSFGKDRAMQSSMLNFFRKVGESATSGAQMALPNLLRDSVMLENDPCTAAACIEGQTSGNFAKSPQRMDEINQLLLILDGVISAEHATSLLEKAGGDVGLALDLYEAEKKDKISLSVNVSEDSIASRDLRDPCNGSLHSVQGPRGNLMVLHPESTTQAISGSIVHSLSSPGSMEPMGSLSLGSGKVDPSLRSSYETKVGSVAVPIGGYHAIDHACWKVGEPAPYLHLARAFDLVEHESGRLRTIDMLCNMFRSLLDLSPEAVLPAVYLAVNRIAPDYEHVDLNIGGNIVSAAVSEVAGVSRAKLRAMYTMMGDLGDVAQACRQKQSILKLPEHLSICLVFSTLKQISKESGSGSGERKKRLVVNLLHACREKEMKYIVRTLVQNMRIGAMMNSVLSGLAQAIVLHHACRVEKALEKPLDSLRSRFQEASASVLEAYNFLPNLDILVPTLITSGVSGLAQNISIAPGIPIKPMLAKITNSVEDLSTHFLGKAFTCEYKYDGQRAQIHMLSDGSVRIFSRNCEETTSRLPDVVDIVQMSADKTMSTFIIDTEVVAVNRDNGNKLMSFQHLSTRERGNRSGAPVDVNNIKVDVCVFAFDMMYANNQSLVKLPLSERRKRMHELFPNRRPGYLEFANEITIDPGNNSMELAVTSQKVEAFLEEAIAASCEGLMAKALVEDSTYRASKRSDSWLKIKRDYVEGLHDTLDLVPIGAWNGNGRKAGWYSPFLLACYDPEREEYQSVCRVMSGFTDSFYKETKEYFSKRLLPQKLPYYRTCEEPDVWFSAEVVWEIRGADFTISPVHQAAIGYIHPSRGISMRFPRFIHTRGDKNPEDATTPSDIAELYNQQTRKVD